MNKKYIMSFCIFALATLGGCGRESPSKPGDIAEEQYPTPVDTHGNVKEKPPIPADLRVPGQEIVINRVDVDGNDPNALFFFGAAITGKSPAEVGQRLGVPSKSDKKGESIFSEIYYISEGINVFQFHINYDDNGKVGTYNSRKIGRLTSSSKVHVVAPDKNIR